MRVVLRALAAASVAALALSAVRWRDERDDRRVAERLRANPSSSGTGSGIHSARRPRHPGEPQLRQFLLDVSGRGRYRRRLHEAAFRDHHAASCIKARAAARTATSTSRSRRSIWSSRATGATRIRTSSSITTAADGRLRWEAAGKVVPRQSRHQGLSIRRSGADRALLDDGGAVRPRRPHVPDPRQRQLHRASRSDRGSDDSSTRPRRRA